MRYKFIKRYLKINPRPGLKIEILSPLEGILKMIEYENFYEIPKEFMSTDKEVKGYEI